MLLRFEVEWHRSRRGVDTEAIGAVDLGPLGSEPAFFGRRSNAVRSTGPAVRWISTIQIVGQVARSWLS